MRASWGFGSFVRGFVVAIGAVSVLGADVPADGAAADPAYFSYAFGGDIGRIAAGPDGSVYVAGWTETPDLPASTSTPEPIEVSEYEVPGFLFVAALAPDGSPMWTSYVRSRRGRTSSPNLPTGLAVAPDGSTWIVGHGTIESVRPFDVADDSDYDAFVARFRSDGTLAFASHLGGSSYELISGLAVSPDGDAIVVGTTSSDDFPGAPAAPNSNNAFVARLAAQGTGVVWARRFGGDYLAGYGSFLRGGSVAVDSQDGTTVFGCFGRSDTPDPPSANVLSAPVRTRAISVGESTSFVLRLAPDGSTIAGARLDFFFESALLAIDGDGRIVVGGTYAIARVNRDLTRVEVARIRREPSEMVTTLMRAAPAGRVLVVDEVRYQEYPPIPTELRVLDPALADEHRPDLATLGARDIAVAADGSLLVAGTWTAAAFNVPAGVTPRRGGFVSKVPLDGVQPPSAPGVEVLGPDSAEFSWKADGDIPSRFDVEARATDTERADAIVVGTAASDASSVRVTDLVPGTNYEFRVVAVFPSGVRSGVAVEGTTPPVTPHAIEVLDGPGNAVVARWDDPNGSRTWYQAQRRIGRGEWITLRSDNWSVPDPRSERRDVVADGSAPVVYRVRAGILGAATQWRVSDPFFPATSLRVTQTSGERRDSRDGVRFAVSGTIESAAGAASFDPAATDLRLLFGDARAPQEFVVPRDDTGWTEAAGVWTWSAARTLSGWGHASEIVLDLPRGTFRVVLESVDRYVIDQRTRSVAINLAFGGLSGGEARTWRGTPRRLSLR